MIWSEVRKAYPDQWLVVEALEAHTEGHQRLLDRIAVIETCPDGASAMQSYQRLHREYPLREFYYVHTGREDLDIRERHFVPGVSSKSPCASKTPPSNVPARSPSAIGTSSHCTPG
jgi:hypothetical protein